VCSAGGDGGFFEELTRARSDIRRSALMIELPLTTFFAQPFNWPCLQGFLMPHKFKIGQLVIFKPSAHKRSGTYAVTKQLPHNGTEFEYRIKGVNEPHERVARESDLERSDDK
jgi:hypothetical protein